MFCLKRICLINSCKSKLYTTKSVFNNYYAEKILNAKFLNLVEYIVFKQVPILFCFNLCVS